MEGLLAKLLAFFVGVAYAAPTASELVTKDGGLNATTSLIVLCGVLSSLLFGLCTFFFIRAVNKLEDLDTRVIKLEQRCEDNHES